MKFKMHQKRKLISYSVKLVFEFKASVNKNIVSRLHQFRRNDYITIMTGYKPERPVSSFGHFNFPDRLMERIRRSDFIDPTPIQSAACPQILAGRDVIGIARTGSGKTAAFIWPIIYHCLKQLPLQDGDGPMAVILAPTRELSQQIYSEVKRFIKNYSKLHAGLCFGGGNMYDQGKELKRGCEILVATPGE